jgi:5-methylthioadenosine/S-adenosylhomocysteine deaminase
MSTGPSAGSGASTVTAATLQRHGERPGLRGHVDYFESIGSNRALLESVGADRAAGRVRAWVGLEHLLYCTEGCFAAAQRLAQEFDTGLHTHSSETTWEVEQSLGRWGLLPVEVFHRRGILGPRTVIAHCVWLDDAEIELLASTGTAVAHCPCSNMKLASGAARVADLRAAGVVVGLGTDGEKENNNLDLLEETKFAALLQKVATLDPTAGDPWDVLSMATIGGAGALGLAGATGSLVPGKRADLVTVCSAACTPRRSSTAATSTSRPTSCSRPRVVTCATSGSTAGGWWRRGGRPRSMPTR